MADNDEDDDSFGEFTFAPIHPTLNSSSQVPVTTSNNDWGDFNLFQNNTTNHNPTSPPPPPPPQPQPQTQPKWHKINGALPLSIFGDDEDTDEKPVTSDDVKQSKFSSDNDNSRKSNAHLGINDLIANLYGPQQQQSVKAADNGGELDFGALNSTVSKDSVSKSDSLNSLSLNTVPEAVRNQGSDDDEGGWEFIDAFADSKVAHNEKDRKGPSEKTVSSPGGSHGPVDLFAATNNGLFVESHVTDNGDGSKPNTNFQNGFSAEFKVDSSITNELSSNAVGGNDDFDDTFGEFETAFMERPPAKKGFSEKTVSSQGVQGGSHGPVDLFAAPNNGLFAESHVTDGGFGSKPSTTLQNGFLAEFKVDSKGSTSELGANPLGGSDDFDDTFGEFETAFMERPSPKKEISEERFDPLGSHDKFHKSVDLFSFSNTVPGGSHMESNGFDFSQIPVVENRFASDPFSQTEWKDTKDDSDSQLPDMSADDESFGKFETTFQESGSKPQEIEASTKNYKEPVPLSIFGIEEDPQADSSLNLEHELFKSSTHGKHTRTLSSNLSINDILSDLYSQAQPVSSHVVDDNDNDDDDFIDGSWEFKDASRVENQNSFKKKLNNCMDLYSNLKDDLCVVARQHLDSLKKAQSTATLAGEEMKVTALNKEIEEALEKLHQKDIISTEMPLDDQSGRVISFKKYVETFQEPDFQALESEYHISTRLLLAESDLRAAIDLINHFTTVLKILTSAPKCEPADYVSLWFKMISVCSQELNHGSWIWKQSLEKNVHSQILSEKQGRQFIAALGEIYRAVMILEAAVKFYKPWILLSGADLKGVNGLLEECHYLWSTSGLEESITADYLLESIRHIQNLNEIAIADQILSQEDSQCGLSLLSPGAVPEMKMVIWNEDKYFVTLANLWANLISPEPPKLSIHFG